MKEKKVLKKPTFLFIYALCIVIILIYIMFFAPSSMFLKGKMADTVVEPKSYPDIFSLFASLKDSDYEYSYNILDSMGKKSVIYLCDGQIKDGSDSGSCSKPKEFTYTQDDKMTKLDGINKNLIDLDYIENLIKEKQAKETNYGGTKKLEYSLELDGMDTDISIYTGYEFINEIMVANMYETYVIKFSFD